MSLRNRIVMVFVLLVLVVPATAWSASQELNPDGRQLSAFDDESPVAASEVTSDPAPRFSSSWEAVETSMDRASAATLFDRFLVWLQAVVQPL